MSDQDIKVGGNCKHGSPVGFLECTDCKIEKLERELNEAKKEVPTADAIIWREACNKATQERDQLRQQLEKEKKGHTQEMNLIVDAHCKTQQQLLASQLREQKMRELLRRACLCRPAESLSVANIRIRSDIQDALSLPTDDSTLKEVREALEEVASLEIKDGSKAYVCWVGESTLLKVKHSLALLGGNNLTPPTQPATPVSPAGGSR